ncbi:hypothetical protein YC2023_018896 [Brassica napus]
MARVLDNLHKHCGRIPASALGQEYPLHSMVFYLISVTFLCDFPKKHMSDNPLVQWFDQRFTNASTPGFLGFNSQKKWNYAN